MENNHFHSVCIGTKGMDVKTLKLIFYTAVADLKVPGDPRTRKASLGGPPLSQVIFSRGVTAVKKESKPQSSSRCWVWVPALRWVRDPLSTHLQATMSARGLERGDPGSLPAVPLLNS